MMTAADRFHLLCDATHRLTTFASVADLLCHATCVTRELCDADVSVLRLAAGKRCELRAAAHSTPEHSSATCAGCVPARSDVARWVLAQGESVIVRDFDSDDRFARDGQPPSAHAALCVPLRAAAGAIGVVELFDQRPGHFIAEDRELLEAVADHIAVAYEKAWLDERAASEVLTPHQTAVLGGGALVTLGLVLMGSAAFVNLALALPLSRLPGRPGVCSGFVCALAGAVLLYLTQRHGRGHAPKASLTRRVRASLTAAQGG